MMTEKTKQHKSYSEQIREFSDAEVKAGKFDTHHSKVIASLRAQKLTQAEISKQYGIPRGSMTHLLQRIIATTTAASKPVVSRADTLQQAELAREEILEALEVAPCTLAELVKTTGLKYQFLANQLRTMKQKATVIASNDRHPVYALPGKVYLALGVAKTETETPDSSSSPAVCDYSVSLGAIGEKRRVVLVTCNTGQNTAVCPMDLVPMLLDLGRKASPQVFQQFLDDLEKQANRLGW